MNPSPGMVWPFPVDIAEKHAHALIFSSLNGARYLYDSTTSSIHPWPWSVTGNPLDHVYAASLESLPALLQQLNAPPELTRYFQQRVSCIVTLNGHSNLAAIRNFFESGDPCIPRIAFLGMLRDMEISNFHKNFPYDPKTLSDQYFELLQEYLERKNNKMLIQKGDFMYHLFEEPLETIYKRVMTSGRVKRTHYTGSCQPGRRLAVSTDGKFHICERINEQFPIGDVEKGVDWDQCRAVMERYYQTLPDCDHCWARALCTSCIAHNCEKTGFDFGRRCNHIRIELAHKLRTLCALLEDVPDAFKTGDPILDRQVMIHEPF